MHLQEVKDTDYVYSTCVNVHRISGKGPPALRTAIRIKISSLLERKEPNMGVLQGLFGGRGVPLGPAVRPKVCVLSRSGSEHLNKTLSAD